MASTKKSILFKAFNHTKYRLRASITKRFASTSYSKSYDLSNDRTSIRDSVKIKSPSEIYKEMVDNNKIRVDQKQKLLIKEFDALSKAVNDYCSLIKEREEQKINMTSFASLSAFLSINNEDKPRPPKGVYIFGTPGTGKTFLMDVFYDSINIRNKKRVHFNKFMLDIHAKLHKIRSENPKIGIDLISSIVQEMKNDFILLCFDEFQVTDIADAVILKSLFTYLFEEGIIVIATSNRHPKDLYKNGLQREAIFLPFIEVLLRHCNVFNLDSGVDYRVLGNRIRNTYFYPIDDDHKNLFENAFRKVTENKLSSAMDLQTTHRTIRIPLASAGACMMDFKTLCTEAFGPSEYNSIASSFHTVFLKDVPQIGSDEEDVLRRFITLIDELYQHKVSLVLLAEVPAGELFGGEVQTQPSKQGEKNQDLNSVESNQRKTKTSGDECSREAVFAWDRCLSRLLEMQSKEYLDESVRVRKKF